MPPPPPPPPVIQMPWENPGAGVKEFFYTLWGIISRPSWAFTSRPAASWPRWVGFAVGVWFIMLVIFLVSHSIQEAKLSLSGALIGLVLLTILMPVQALILLPFYTWMIRFTLRALAKGGDYPSFSLVLRLVCYSQVASLGSIVPILGTWAALIWNIYLLSVGLRVGLGQSKGNAILAAIAPVLAMTILIFFLTGLVLTGL